MTVVSRRLLYVVNDAAFFVRHGLGPVSETVSAGYEVHVAVPPGPGISTITADGACVHSLPLNRPRVSPWRAALTIAALGRLHRQLRPELVHHISVKPVLYGTRAARATGVAIVVNTIPGLGWLFTGEGTTAGLRRRAAVGAYRLALRHHRMRVILQNPGDRDQLVRSQTVPAELIVLIEGAGVDVDEFETSSPPSGVPILLLPARMLRDKGVAEFVEAARVLRDQVNARFALVGVSTPTIRRASMQRP